VLFWSGLLKRLTGARIVYLAPRADIAGKPALLRRFAHVDFILASRLCPSLADVLARCGGRYRCEAHGVDLGRFALRSREENPARRFRVFGEDRQPCGPVLVHVGHLRRNRGIERLISLKIGLGNSAEVVVLGSPTFRPDPSLVSELKGAGVVVRIGFIEDLHTCYRAADLYVFPGADEEGGAVDLPLTVLEALACGTPVLSTPFGSLPDILAGVPEIRFAEAGSLLPECREFVRDPERSPRRSRPLPARYDLRSLSKRLISFLAEDAAA
jgi:glycosyltransferase involved in cell wall biosynthesis